MKSKVQSGSPQEHSPSASAVLAAMLHYAHRGNSAKKYMYQRLEEIYQTVGSGRWGYKCSFPPI